MRVIMPAIIDQAGRPFNADEPDAISRRHRHRRRPLGELPVGEPPATGANHRPVLRAKARAVDLPDVGGRREEHLARGRPRLAEPLPLAGDALAAAGELHAEHRVVVGWVDRRGDDLHAAQVHLQLLRDEHR
jgi:hypothetical protein